MEPVKNIDLTDLKPLPEELQKLTRDDAECKYCGIPYLILHEVKELQKKCAGLEAQLGEYNEAVGIRADLEEQLAKAKEELKRLEELPALKSEFGRLHELVSSLEEECAQAEKDRDRLDIELHQQKSASELAKLEHVQLQTNYTQLEQQHSKLQTQTKDLQEGLNLKIQENSELFERIRQQEAAESEHVNQMKSTTKHHQELTQQNAILEGKCENLERSVRELERDKQGQGESLSSARAELESFRNARGELEQRMVKIKQESVQIESMNTHLESQLELLKKTYQLKTEQAEAKIAKLTQENADIQNTFGSQAKSLEIFRSNEELLKKRLKESQEQSSDADKRSEDLTAKVSNLEKELKITISSHQARLEELTEFYRSEITKFKDTKKAEIELDKIKAQYAVEMDQREQALKEYFQVELEIEVEKRVESIKLQCQKTILGTEDDLNQARDEKKTLESHCEDLQRQLKGNRTRAMAVENELNAQIGKLKSTVERLRSDMSVVLQKQMVYEKEQKATGVQPVHGNGITEEMQAKIAGYEQKIAELERTIQRECEERMALLADRTAHNTSTDSDVLTGRAFSSSTLKLLSLSPSKGGGEVLPVAESKSQPMVYIPQNLADLTKVDRISPTKPPLPSLGSHASAGDKYSGVDGGRVRAMKAGGYAGSVVSGSSRNTNTQRAAHETPSVKSSTSTTAGRRKPDDPSDMDALRRKIRLAIKQRQRQHSGT